MRTLNLLLSAFALLAARPALAATTESEPGPVVQGTERAGEPRLRLHAEYDLGVLALGGIGVHAGVNHGPWTTGLGFYRFESKSALGGFDDDFKLHVDYIAAAQVGYFFNGKTDDGFYGKVIYQLKQQTVTHKASGAERALTSHLIGPEIGYEWDFWAGLFVRPRLGVLYYAKSPQPGRDPVTVGGGRYDNPTHNYIDAYVTADLGYEFDL